METVSVIDLIGNMLPLVVAWAAGLVMSIVALALVVRGRRVNPLVLPGGLGVSVLALWAYGAWHLWGLEALGPADALAATQAAALAKFVGWLVLTGHAGILGMALAAGAVRGASWRVGPGLGLVFGAAVAVGLIAVGGTLHGAWVMAIARGLGYALVGGLLGLVFMADGKDAARSDLRVGGAWIFFLTLYIGEVGYRGLALYLLQAEVAGAGPEIRVALVTELHRIAGLEMPWQVAAILVGGAMALAVTVQERRHDGQRASIWLGAVWLLMAGMLTALTGPSLEQLIAIAGALP